MTSPLRGFDDRALRAHDLSCPAQPGVIEGDSRGHAPSGAVIRHQGRRMGNSCIL
jgi:hypothetical protein